ncbi:hypothetical protein BS78_04G132300 [Paspalum vaginatum]|nr:hypothetical protein BS78_04G132300 [Paspalum vaginatum]
MRCLPAPRPYLPALALLRCPLPCAPPHSASSSRRPAPPERHRGSHRPGAVAGCALPRLVHAPDAGRPRGPSPTLTARQPECHRGSCCPKATAGPDLLAEEETCVPAPSMNPAAVDPVTGGSRLEAGAGDGHLPQDGAHRRRRPEAAPH